MINHTSLNKFALAKSSVIPLIILVIISFILLVLFIAYSYTQSLYDLEKASLEAELESQKMKISSELMELARSRTRITAKIIDTYDAFDQDALNFKLNEYAADFSTLRLKLLKHSLSHEELDILSNNDSIVATILPAQRSAVELAMSDSDTDKRAARELLYNVVLPGQQNLINGLGRLISVEQQRIAELSSQNHTALLTVRNRNIAIISIALLAVILLSTVLLIRIRRIELDLVHSHSALKQTNAELEQKVAERTKELSDLNKRLLNTSEHDELTGLYNRRKFNEQLIDEYVRIKRSESYFSLMMIDIDYFKLFNDHYGHQKGDDCLSAVAAAMESSLPRPTDFIARYGGEEFSIILPTTDSEGALVVAEHVRQAVFDLKIPHELSEVSPYVTISLGISTYYASAKPGINDIVNDADKCLYIAKSKGRNRACASVSH